MLTDANDVERNALVRADLCLVGAGPAGITIARRLVGRGLRVVLLESGGFEADEATQELYDGDTAGVLADHPEYPVTSRLRRFGGSSNHWGGWCRPLEPGDFRPRPWIPLSGWPLRRADLDDAYAAACELCEIAPFGADDLGPRDWRRPPLGLAGDRASLVSRIFHLSPGTNFGTAYRRELVEADDVEVVIRANATALLPAEGGGALEGVEVRTLAGNRFRVGARVTVLCAGGLENPRLLLLPAPGAPTGLGNRHDMVGRCFMEHPHLPVGEAMLWRHRRLLRLYTHRLVDRHRGHRVVALLFTSDEFQERTHTADVSLVLGLNRPFEAHRPGAAIAAVARNLDRRLPGPVERTHPHPFPQLDAWQEPGRSLLLARSEQVPNPDSRVRLAERRDDFGLPRLVVDWRLQEIDYRSLAEATRELARNLLASRQGRARVSVDPVDPEGYEIGYGNHHMGTTRMSEDPKTGVVDADCRVHGVRNLYVAGSSVFPTSGAANPTLTLVALAWRLANHLRQELS